MEANDAIVAAEQQAALVAAQAAERMKKKERDMDNLAKEEDALKELNATVAADVAGEMMAKRADSLYKEDESLDESEEGAQYRRLEEECRRERGGPMRQRADPVVGPEPQGKASIPATALPEPGRTRSPSPIKQPRPHLRASALPRHSSPTKSFIPAPALERRPGPPRGSTRTTVSRGPGAEQQEPWGGPGLLSRAGAGI